MRVRVRREEGRGEEGDSVWQCNSSSWRLRKTLSSTTQAYCRRSVSSCCLLRGGENSLCVHSGVTVMLGKIQGKNLCTNVAEMCSQNGISAYKYIKCLLLYSNYHVWWFGPTLEVELMRVW